MAITRQAYEWRGLVPRDVDYAGVISAGPDYVIGQPILGSFEKDAALPATDQQKPWQQFVVPDIKRGYPIEIMWGQKGNNLKTSANSKNTELLIIDGLACWPPDSNLNVYVNDRYYFEAPDYSSVAGLSGNMVPFPEPNSLNIFTHECFRNGIYPPVIVEPLSSWGVFWNSETDITAFVPTDDDQVPRAFVRYFLVDGPDLLIAQQLMKLHIPLSLRNFVKYRQDVLRWHTMGDSHVFRVNEGVDR